MTTQREEISIAVLGSDGHGKHLLTQVLRGNRERPSPHVSGHGGMYGTYVSTFEGVRVRTHDLCNGKAALSTWKPILRQCHGLVFLVNGTDHDKLAQAKWELHTTAGLAHKPLLILFDVHFSQSDMRAHHAAQEFELHKLGLIANHVVEYDSSDPMADREIRRAALWLCNVVRDSYARIKSGFDRGGVDTGTHNTQQTPPHRSEPTHELPRQSLQRPSELRCDTREPTPSPNRVVWSPMVRTEAHSRRGQPLHVLPVRSNVEVSPTSESSYVSPRQPEATASTVHWHHERAGWQGPAIHDHYSAHQQPATTSHAAWNSGDPREHGRQDHYQVQRQQPVTGSAIQWHRADDTSFVQDTGPYGKRHPDRHDLQQLARSPISGAHFERKPYLTDNRQPHGVSTNPFPLFEAQDGPATGAPSYRSQQSPAGHSVDHNVWVQVPSPVASSRVHRSGPRSDHVVAPAGYQSSGLSPQRELQNEQFRHRERSSDHGPRDTGNHPHSSVDRSDHARRQPAVAESKVNRNHSADLDQERKLRLRRLEAEAQIAEAEARRSRDREAIDRVAAWLKACASPHILKDVHGNESDAYDEVSEKHRRVSESKVPHQTSIQPRHPIPKDVQPDKPRPRDKPVQVRENGEAAKRLSLARRHHQALVESFARERACERIQKLVRRFQYIEVVREAVTKQVTIALGTEGGIRALETRAQARWCFEHGAVAQVRTVFSNHVHCVLQFTHARPLLLGQSTQAERRRKAWCRRRNSPERFCATVCEFRLEEVVP